MTIKELKTFVKFFTNTPKVSITSVDMSNDFSKEYKSWKEFKEDTSVDHLELDNKYYALDIFEYEIEIWVK